MSHNMQTTRTTSPGSAREYPATRTLHGRADSPRVLAVEVQGGQVLFDLINPGSGEVKSFAMDRATWDQLIADHA